MRDEAKGEMRIRVLGHTEGDLLVLVDSQARCGDMVGMCAEFAGQRGAFLINVEDMKAAIAEYERSAKPLPPDDED